METTRTRTPPPAGYMISDSGWRAQIAAAARLMVADGRGLRRRTAHVVDDKGELEFVARRSVEVEI